MHSLGRILMFNDNSSRTAPFGPFGCLRCSDTYLYLSYEFATGVGTQAQGTTEGRYTEMMTRPSLKRR
jgi:hypothetical protein